MLDTVRPGIAPVDGLSQVAGATDTPLLDYTVSAILDKTVAAFGSREAVVFREQNIRWTWRQFAEEVDCLAAGLLALGMQKGERIGIWSPNRAEWLLTQFATARIGLILVNINPAYRLSELEYALNKVECKAIIAAESFKTSQYLQMLQTLAPELAHCAPGTLAAAKLPHLNIVIRMGEARTGGMFNFADVTALATPALIAQARAIGATLQAHEPINIQFTSGTTGQPKGATLTHHNIVNNAAAIAACMKFTERDKLAIPVPLYQLLWHGAGGAGLCFQRRLHGVSVRGL